MKTAIVKVTGVSPLLINNPQTVDRFNKYARRMAEINDKKTKRTDDDFIELGDIEVRSRIFFSEELGVFVPSSWVAAAVAANSFRVAKISKADVRGSLFMSEKELKLYYRGMERVKEPIDIVNNGEFRFKMNLKQGQNRLIKHSPIFHDWHFTCEMEYDEKTIDPDSLQRILEHASKYGGFGDFRPTFGRAIAEVNHV